MLRNFVNEKDWREGLVWLIVVLAVLKEKISNVGDRRGYQVVSKIEHSL